MLILFWSVAILAGTLALVFVVPSLRRTLVSNRILATFRKVLPPMSQTEREAIEAGTTFASGRFANFL